MLRDEAWFESRGKNLYRSFLMKFAKIIIATEKAGYDPGTINVSALIDQFRSELKTVDSKDLIDIMARRKNGQVSIAHHELLGFVCTFHGEYVWSVFDNRLEDALQRLFDQIQDVPEVME